jgi:hypothetical protein
LIKKVTTHVSCCETWCDNVRLVYLTRPPSVTPVPHASVVAPSWASLLLSQLLYSPRHCGFAWVMLEVRERNIELAAPFFWDFAYEEPCGVAVLTVGVIFYTHLIVVQPSYNEYGIAGV